MVPREARGGGLVLFWRDTMAVTIEGSDKYHIDAIINKITDSEWRFTSFYGKHKEDLNHGIYFDGSTRNFKSHGCV